MLKNCGIYLITNLEDGKVYLGSSRNLDGGSRSRRYRHFYDLKRGGHSNRHLQSAYNQYGEGAFQWEVLMYLPEGIIDKDLLHWEDYFIGWFDALNPEYGYNFLSADRHTVSEETRNKIGSASRGKPRHSYSEEFRAKLSASKTGKKQSPETIEKRISKLRGRERPDMKGKPSPMKGRTHTEEARAKISANNWMKGKPSPKKGKKVSEEIAQKSSSTWFREGSIPWNKGLKNVMVPWNKGMSGGSWSEARRAAYERNK